MGDIENEQTYMDSKVVSASLCTGIRRGYTDRHTWIAR
jgi:hypothetical protein